MTSDHHNPEVDSQHLLFSAKVDRYKTMLAYEANYFPYWHMKSAHKIVHSNRKFLTKEKLLNHCDETLSYMDQLPIERRFTEQPFRIRWAYNNVPTEIEWNKIYKHSNLYVEFRISPLIEANNGRIALITPHLQEYYKGNKE